MIGGHFEGSLTEKQAHCETEVSAKGGRPRATIDMLPDVALLKIFDFYLYEEKIEAWHVLVHVCQKWRDVVFGSPRHLNLRLFYNARTPVRETLDIWPPLPIVTSVYGYEKWDVDNIIAALEHNDRISELYLFDIPSSQFEKVLETMQRQPFPSLKHLELQPKDETTLVDPASFLGGSAPRLQTLILGFIPCPGLPKLLLSATHLVDLKLWGISYSGYISPEAMTTGLSVLTKLETLTMVFKSPRCRPDPKSRCPPLQTRTLLPALTDFRFRGVGEYLEDLVARIDVPRLDNLMITIFHQLIFDTPRLTQFISRTPKFKAHHSDEARLTFSNWHVWIDLPQTSGQMLELTISCRRPDWQLSSMAQVCSSSFPQALIPAVKHLYIIEVGFCNWQDNIENAQWLELLRPFTAVKNLYLSQRFAHRIAPALQELVGIRVTEVLPALRTILLETPPLRPVQETIEQFAAARKLASHSITVSHWERK